MRPNETKSDYRRRIPRGGTPAGKEDDGGANREKANSKKGLFRGWILINENLLFERISRNPCKNICDSTGFYLKHDEIFEAGSAEARRMARPGDLLQKAASSWPQVEGRQRRAFSWVGPADRGTGIVINKMPGFQAAIFLLIMMGNSKADEPSSPGRVEEFKQFLSSRPAIKNLVFSYASPSGSISGPFKTNFFQAAWEGEDFFVRQIAATDAWAAKTPRTFDNSPVFCGRYGSKYFYVQTGLIVEVPVAPMPPRPDPIDRTTMRALGTLPILQACLNLGLWDTKTNSFSWDGNAFAAKAGNETEIARAMVRHQPKGSSEPGEWVALDRSNKPFTGRIETEGDAVRNLETSTKSMTVKYEYLDSNPLTPRLPNKIEMFSGGLLRGQFEILKIETSTEPQQDSYFAPDNFLEPGHYRPVFTAKGRLKIENPAQAHEYIVALKNSPSFMGPREGRGWRLLGLLVFVSAFLGPPLYYLARRLKND